jgi:hypothetical protein
MLACALFSQWARVTGVAPPAAVSVVLAALSASAAGAGVWFIALQFFVLRRACVYCMLAHIAAIGAAILIVSRSSMLAGIAAAVAFALAQVSFPPNLTSFTETPVEPESAPSGPVFPAVASPPPARTMTSDLPRAEPPQRPMRHPRPVVLLRGQLRFDASRFPLIGPHDATHLVADVMDYACEVCRAFHPLLERAIESFNGELAVLVFCAPMERACNPHIDRDDPRYAGACRYARLALAVWEADPPRFAEFHRWLLRSPRVPKYEDARRRADECVGAQAIEQALAGAGVQQQLDEALTIFRLTGAKLPRLLLPTGMLMGGSNSEQHLITLLRTQLEGGAITLAAAPPTIPAPAGTGAFSSKRID